MLFDTSTLAELCSEARKRAGQGWRLVEAQHHVATLKLADDLDDQAILEGLIEATKEHVPRECAHLHYLLYTPFRYVPYPHGSRYRRAGLTPGVFYAAEQVETAAAEAAFYRLLFFAESPGTPWPVNPLSLTAFRFAYAHDRVLDLFTPAFAPHRAALTRLADYEPTQRLADAARSAAVGVIRYPSVRDPDGGANLALFTCLAFAASQPDEQQTWHVQLNAHGVHCLCETTRARLSFRPDAFAADIRLAGMRWTR